MKILQIMAGAKHGGAETAFVDMCLALKEAGEDIAVVTRTNDIRVSQLEGAGIKVHTAPFGGMIDVYTPWRVGKIIAAFEPIIVQTWMARAAQKTPNWSRLKTRQRYATVARLGGYYKVQNFRSIDYFAAITPDIKRHLVEGGKSEDRIVQISNFAETEEATSPINRADLDTPDGSPVVLTLARLHESKALDILLTALADLPGVYAWIAGEGPARRQLETLASDLGISDRVRFLGWRTDRAALLQAADICVFASRVEPFGTVFVQAWAQGTPVIVSDADGPRQFCRDGEDSLMVPRENAEALAITIRKLLADERLRQKLIENGFRRYNDEFTKQQSVAAYLAFYADILKREGIT